MPFSAPREDHFSTAAGEEELLPSKHAVLDADRLSSRDAKNRRRSESVRGNRLLHHRRAIVVCPAEHEAPLAANPHYQQLSKTPVPDSFCEADRSFLSMANNGSGVRRVTTSKDQNPLRVSAHSTSQRLPLAIRLKPTPKALALNRFI